ncbi:unnamed protein product [Paramecium octaurelia]|uniref:Uncharacterized protein n=1 Tax=Paramecium octaurelia TaxID=43137 RepID=A0A8S1T623_PAROT|nr:unnamed protein product [Paramecium octaurelia]
MTKSLIKLKVFNFCHEANFGFKKVRLEEKQQSVNQVLQISTDLFKNSYDLMNDLMSDGLIDVGRISLQKNSDHQKMEIFPYWMLLEVQAILHSVYLRNIKEVICLMKIQKQQSQIQINLFLTLDKKEQMNQDIKIKLTFLCKRQRIAI